MDLAPYHRERVPGTAKPTTRTNKRETLAWFRRYGHPCEDKETLKVLRARIKLLPDTTIYLLEQEAGLQGHFVLWQPPKHCDFNPIELIWAQIKGWVASHNTTYKIADVYDLTLQAFDRVTPADWARACEHVKKVEKEFWRLENLQPAIEPVIVNIQSDLEDTDSELDENTPNATDSEVEV